jgi:hypothetical protein
LRAACSVNDRETSMTKDHIFVWRGPEAMSIGTTTCERVERAAGSGSEPRASGKKGRTIRGTAIGFVMRIRTLTMMRDEREDSAHVTA